ncbi:hypothetical protein BpHYR1_007644 [Brachionus plicatilis]|uniref:Uncharacterized protein n=1 Tax=Brachionus plicatilis TaxID=10195 RepID=A0A3M7RXA6_BRAPC|nr:hypothetical protein BpHYR1_007644 [Brachionus plicatilis]
MYKSYFRLRKKFQILQNLNSFIKNISQNIIKNINNNLNLYSLTENSISAISSVFSLGYIIVKPHLDLNFRKNYSGDLITDFEKILPNQILKFDKKKT